MTTTLRATEPATRMRLSGPKRRTTNTAYQWATVQLVGNAVPLVLDVRPVPKG
jgi:hypothetical protein